MSLINLSTNINKGFVTKEKNLHSFVNLFKLKIDFGKNPETKEGNSFNAAIQHHQDQVS